MRLKASLTLASALAGGLLVLGCSTVASSMMVPETVEVERTLGGTVIVHAHGSEKQAMFGRRLIEPDALQAAVRESILRSQLFEEVIDAGDADNVLTVSFDQIREPEVGLDATCTLSMRWRLQSGDRSRTLWEEVITTEETVHSYQEMSSELRGMAVIEKTIRANIRRGLMRLSKGRTPR